MAQSLADVAVSPADCCGFTGITALPAGQLFPSNTLAWKLHCAGGRISKPPSSFLAQVTRATPASPALPVQSTRQPPTTHLRPRVSPSNQTPPPCSRSSKANSKATTTPPPPDPKNNSPAPTPLLPAIRPPPLKPILRTAAQPTNHAQHPPSEKYQPPPGPPPNPNPSTSSYAPPPNPPSHASFPNQPPPTWSPPPYHDWTVIPDTALLPPPPSIGYDASPTANATEEDGERADQWCIANPLWGPQNLAPAVHAAIQNAQLALLKPPHLPADVFPMREAGHWKVRTARAHQFLHLVLLRQLTPHPQLMSKLEHNEGNQAQKRAEHGQDQSRILTPHVVEEGARKQRRHSSQRVPHQPLSRNRRRRVLPIAIRRIAVRALKHEEDAERDERKSNDRPHPDQVPILRKRVNEQSDGHPHSAEHGSVQSVLRNNPHVRIRLQRIVLAHLQVVRRPSEERADCQRDIRESADTLGPPPLLLERNRDDGEKQEDNSPAEGDPQTEGENHGLGDQHADCLHRRRAKHGLQIRRVDVVFRHVAIVSRRLAQLLRPPVQLYASTRLGEKQENGDEQRDVGEPLDALNPPPSNRLVDKPRVNGRRDGTKDGHKREHRHRSPPLMRLVHIVEGTSHQDRAHAAEQPKKQSQPDNRPDILRQREPDEDQRETQKRPRIHYLPSRQLAQRRQHHRRNRTRHIKREQSQLSHDLRDPELLAHAANAGTIRRGSQSNEQRHQIQHRAYPPLVPRIPIKRILSIPRRERQHDVLLPPVFHYLSEGDRHIHLHPLQRPTICIYALALLTRVLPSHDPAYYRLPFFVDGDRGGDGRPAGGIEGLLGAGGAGEVGDGGGGRGHGLRAGVVAPDWRRYSGEK
ncbi:hypothetical protein GRF29_164g286846 [Pseudopithomyces chartarum]|uniref:Uncharacterized protein n=1 Tax=Pseudopithomyces chartarum TaxID=1892770 RepID=A0AAN6LPK4_9PLEO|nr:hypothetical protein GRF29_164g286846 [Pseudopithomyces chartarum]